MRKSFSENIDLLLACLLYIGLFLSGPLYELHLGVTILPFDIVCVAALVFAARRIFFEKSFKASVRIFPRTMIVYAFLFFLITALDILRSPHPFSVGTLLIAVVRNFALLFLITMLMCRTRLLQERIMSAIAWITAAISGISLIAYFYCMFLFDNIRSHPALWHPGIWYYLSEGRVLRLSGFGADPNFFVAAALIGFAFSLFFFDRSAWRKTASIVIFLALAFTVSKIVLVILFAIPAGLAALYLIKRRAEPLQILRRYAQTAGSSLLILVFLGLISPQLNLWNMYQSRISSAEYGLARTSETADERTSLWRSAYELFSRHPVLGAGGKAVYFERGEYVHNDYLEFLSSYGIVGFAVFMAFLFYSLAMPFQYLSDPIVLAPYLSVACYAIFMIGFSVFFNPFLFFALGCLWGNINNTKPA